jgi:hypothetical protein
MKEEKMAKKRMPLTRRHFLRGTLGTTVGASLVGTGFLKTGRITPGKSLVIIVRDKSAMDADNNVDTGVLRSMLNQTLIEVTGKATPKEAWLSLVTPDDTVGLVPTPHLNPTHEEVVEAVRGSLIQAGIPGEKIVEAQGGPDKPKACTALVALPGLKAHWLTGIGTVMKLYIMYSGNPRNYHNEDSAKLGEIWNYPFVKGKTKLVLVDALHPLCDKGPQVDPRYKWAYNGLIAGTDPVAVESVCLRIIQEKRKKMRGEPWPLSPPPICVEAADKTYGLGSSSWDNIKLESFGWTDDMLLG